MIMMIMMMMLMMMTMMMTLKDAVQDKAICLLGCGVSACQLTCQQWNVRITHNSCIHVVSRDSSAIYYDRVDGRSLAVLFVD